MVSSGPSPLAVVRDGMWGFLLFAGVAWLAISWSVLRLEPGDIVQVAGPVVLFGALMEAVRALAGDRTWWLNAGMTVLFAATGIILLTGSDTSYTTPAALVGWFLMVRGAADVAVSMMSRETDRIWGLLLVVGVGEAALGFFAASPFARSAELMVTVLGALGLMRGVADLVAALRLREQPRMTLLELPPERAAGVAGYSAGLTDYESAPAAGPRHRAVPRVTSADALSAFADAGTANGLGDSGTDTTTTVITGTGQSAATASGTGTSATAGGGTGTSGTGTSGTGANSGKAADLGTGWAGASWAGGGRTGDAEATSGIEPMAGPEAATTSGTAAADQAAAGTQPGTFHDQVLRTTADLDMMLALAGVTGAAVGSPLPELDDAPEVPDSPAGVELPSTGHPGTNQAGLDSVTRSGESAKPI